MFSSPCSYVLVQTSALQPGKHLNLYSSLVIKETLTSLLFSPMPEEGGWEEAVHLGLQLVGWVPWLQEVSLLFAPELQRVTWDSCASSCLPCATRCPPSSAKSQSGLHRKGEESKSLTGWCFPADRLDWRAQGEMMGRQGRLPGGWRVWLPLAMRGVPDRASGAGVGQELLVVTVEGDLVPFQPAAGSRSRAGVLLSMGLALVERHAASCPSYSGFPAAALLKSASCVATTCLFG